MKSSIIIHFSLIFIFACYQSEAKHMQKRQIYREQVLPHAGGKIPDSAFQVDRLALNKLQKEGIAIPDGFQLEPREYQVYPYNQRTRRPTFLAALKPSNRFTPSVGEYHFNDIPSVETTYVVPQISGHSLSLPPKQPIIPVLNNPLNIPNSASLSKNYGGRSYPQYQTYNILYDIPQKIHHSAPPSQQLLVRPQSRLLALSNNLSSRPNKQFIGAGPVEPLLEQPLHWSNFQQDYVTSTLFNDFETFFKDYAHQHRAPQFSQRRIRDLEKETKTLDLNNNKKRN